MLQIICRLLSNAEALPRGCNDRKEMGMCRGTSALAHQIDTFVLPQHLLGLHTSPAPSAPGGILLGASLLGIQRRGWRDKSCPP